MGSTHCWSLWWPLEELQILILTAGQEARVQFEYETQRTGRLQLPLSEVIDYQLRLLCWIIVKQTTVLIHLPVPTVDHIKIN